MKEINYRLNGMEISNVGSLGGRLGSINKHRKSVSLPEFERECPICKKEMTDDETIYLIEDKSGGNAIAHERCGQVVENILGKLREEKQDFDADEKLEEEVRANELPF